MGAQHAGLAQMARAQPNAGHFALTRLQHAGWLQRIVTLRAPRPALFLHVDPTRGTVAASVLPRRLAWRGASSGRSDPRRQPARQPIIRSTIWRPLGMVDSSLTGFRPEAPRKACCTSWTLKPTRCCVKVLIERAIVWSPDVRTIVRFSICAMSSSRRGCRRIKGSTTLGPTSIVWACGPMARPTRWSSVAG